MKAGGGGAPSGRIGDLINQSFGSYQAFRTEFENAGNTAFGSGWAWLVHTPSGLKVTKTIGAETPLTEAGSTPLLTMVCLYLLFLCLVFTNHIGCVGTCVLLGLPECSCQLRHRLHEQLGQLGVCRGSAAQVSKEQSMSEIGSSMISYYLVV